MRGSVSDGWIGGHSESIARCTFTGHQRWKADGMKTCKKKKCQHISTPNVSCYYINRGTALDMHVLASLIRVM